MYYFLLQNFKNMFEILKKAINCLHKRTDMYITDFSSLRFAEHIRPCNKRRHLRQSLATTCTCLIIVSHKSASPLLLPLLSPLCAYMCSRFLRISFFPQFPSRSSFDVQTVFIFGTHDISISNTFL